MTRPWSSVIWRVRRYRWSGLSTMHQQLLRPHFHTDHSSCHVLYLAMLQSHGGLHFFGFHFFCIRQMASDVYYSFLGFIGCCTLWSLLCFISCIQCIQPYLASVDNPYPLTLSAYTCIKCHRLNFILRSNKNYRCHDYNKEDTTVKN